MPLQLLQAFQVHGQISSQLLAYLFFFTNASLFNTLMERGEYSVIQREEREKQETEKWRTREREIKIWGQSVLNWVG